MYGIIYRIDKTEERGRTYEIHSLVICLFLGFWRNRPQWARASSFTRFLDHTQRRTTIGRTPSDEWLARRRDLYLTTHKFRSRQISIQPVGFELTISAGERPKTYALDCAVNWTAKYIHYIKYITIRVCVEKKNQLDVAVCFIALMICSTCFGHFYDHHQEL